MSYTHTVQCSAVQSGATSKCTAARVSSQARYGEEKAKKEVCAPLLYAGDYICRRKGRAGEERRGEEAVAVAVADADADADAYTIYMYMRARR